MALSRVKTWVGGDVLTAADQNAEFNNILNNPISLISPTTGAINFQTSVAHTNLTPSAITGSSGGAGALLVQSTSVTSVWLAIGTSGQVITAGTSGGVLWAAPGAVTSSNQAVAQAWVLFNGAGSSGTVTSSQILGSYGISSIIKSATGKYTINFSGGFSSGNYAVVANGTFTAAAPTYVGVTTCVKSTTQVDIVGTNDLGGPADSAFINLIAFGPPV